MQQTVRVVNLLGNRTVLPAQAPPPPKPDGAKVSYGVVHSSFTGPCTGAHGVVICGLSAPSPELLFLSQLILHCRVRLFLMFFFCLHSSVVWCCQIQSKSDCMKTCPVCCELGIASFTHLFIHSFDIVFFVLRIHQVIVHDFNLLRK